MKHDYIVIERNQTGIAKPRMSLSRIPSPALLLKITNIKSWVFILSPTDSLTYVCVYFFSVIWENLHKI